MLQESIERTFEVLAAGLRKEAGEVHGYPTARPLLRYAGLRGLPTRSEAHICHTVASALGSAGFKCFVDEPYTVEHREGIRRFDVRVVLEEADPRECSRFLTLEVKCFTSIDDAMRGMLRDVEKIREVLNDEHAILNTPIGILVVGFSHDGRSSRMQKRYESFQRRANVAEWLHLSQEFEIAPDGQPMRHCLLDFWCALEPE